jgi:citrate synthase
VQEPFSQDVRLQKRHGGGLFPFAWVLVGVAGWHCATGGRRDPLAGRVNVFRPDLEGVIAFETEIGEADRERSALRYRGIDSEGLLGQPFEKVWGLLVHGSFEPGRPRLAKIDLTRPSGSVMPTCRRVSRCGAQRGVSARSRRSTSSKTGTTRRESLRRHSRSSPTPHAGTRTREQQAARMSRSRLRLRQSTFLLLRSCPALGAADEERQAARVVEPASRTSGDAP